MTNKKRKEEKQINWILIMNDEFKFSLVKLLKMMSMDFSMSPYFRELPMNLQIKHEN